MSTSWKSQQGNGQYSLQFETDDKEKYKVIEKTAQMMMDGKTPDVVNQRRKYYKVLTDEIFVLYECFKESGFTEDQAFELANIYVRQSMFENIISERKRSNTDILRERLKKEN